MARCDNHPGLIVRTMLGVDMAGATNGAKIWTVSLLPLVIADFLLPHGYAVAELAVA